MSYTKTTWKIGDVITAEKLNNIESGVETAGSTLLITITDGGSTMATMDKIWKEIYDAFMAGIPCIATYEQQSSLVNSFVASVGIRYGSYIVEIDSSGSLWGYATNSENGYPQYSFD